MGWVCLVLLLGVHFWGRNIQMFGLYMPILELDDKSQTQSNVNGRNAACVFRGLFVEYKVANNAVSLALCARACVCRLSGDAPTSAGGVHP